MNRKITNKKKLLIFFGAFIILITRIRTTYGYIEKEESKKVYKKYNEAQQMIKEVMKSYYLKGPYIQYNSAKSAYEVESPEEATSQKMKYDVCSVFVYDVYGETFGMSYKVDKFPRTSSEFLNEGKKYYDSKNARDGTFLIYYEDTKNNKKYIYNNANTFDEFVKNIQPGDIFAYTGHGLLAYDVVINPKTGKKDVLMLNSVHGSQISSRIASSNSRIFYNVAKNKNGTNGYLDIEAEGTIQQLWLSEDTRFVNNGKISCSQDECTVIRPFYKNSNNKAVFNYSINESNYKKSKLRSEYPGLIIEKIINVGDRNSVYIGDELTYTIKITNKSGITNNPVSYKNFYVEETFGDYVSYISINNNGQLSGNTIKWNINKLASNETIELSYKVKVKNNLNNVSKIIKSVGKFSSSENNSISISTGIVENKIIPKVSNLNNSYQTCYSSKKNDYSGLELINEIYKCTSNNDFNFTDFKFENIFAKKKDIVASTTSDAIYFKTNMNSLSEKFSNMILNNYWNGLVKYKESKTSSNYYINLPEWGGSSAGFRAKTINSTDFKNGDILIYSINYNKTASKDIHTKENGIYAYIFIDGKFVGNNYSGDKGRDEFTYNYYKEKSLNISKHLYTGYSKLTSNQTSILDFVNYQTLFDKDYYVILRPELLIKELESIKITTNPTKIKYIQNKENLDLSGGVLTVTYNDGTKDTISLTSKDVVVTGFNNQKVGKKTLTIEYLNLTTNFEVEIKSELVIDIDSENNLSNKILIFVVGSLLLFMGSVYIL